MPDTFVTHSIFKINDDQWLLGMRFIISRTPTESPGCWRSDDGAFFSIARAPFPAPDFTLLPMDDNSPFMRPSNVADFVEARWRIGDATLKIVEVRPNVNLTPEHISTEFARGIQPRSFNVPEVLFYGEWKNLRYLITRRLPGVTLRKAFALMSVAQRDAVAERVARACLEMANARRSLFAVGVDGRWVYDYEFAVTGEGASLSLHPERRRRDWASMGMDVSEFVFAHNDLGDDTIIVEPVTGEVGFIDWGTAGYVPRDYIRTLFAFTTFDIPDPSPFVWGELTPAEQYEGVVEQKLAEAGFKSFATEFYEWKVRIDPTQSERVPTQVNRQKRLLAKLPPGWGLASVE